MPESIQQIRTKIVSSEKFSQLITSLREGNVFLSGVSSSLTSFILDHCHKKLSKKNIFYFL